MKQLSLSSKIMALFGGIVLLFLLNLSLGSLSIPVKDIWNICLGDREGVDPIWINIVTKSRLPQSITAISAGAGLAVSGLFMQTVFRNPLAGPSVLGISSGASLGVALVVLLSGSLGGIILSSLGVLGELAVTLGATLGALSVMIIIAYVSQKVKGNVTLLIIGVMIGYVANAVIGVLKYFSVEEDIKAYVVWGLGSFSRIGPSQVPLFSLTILLLLLLSILLIKTLNLMLLGENYARSLGLNIKRARLLVISTSGIFVAVVTAFCGPIIFLGLAVPHLCRALFQTSDHRILLPTSILVGGAMALLCNLIARLPGLEGALPINSVTALIGAPIVISVLFKRHRGEIKE